MNNINFLNFQEGACGAYSDESDYDNHGTPKAMDLPKVSTDSLFFNRHPNVGDTNMLFSPATVSLRVQGGYASPSLSECENPYSDEEDIRNIRSDITDRIYKNSNTEMYTLHNYGSVKQRTSKINFGALPVKSKDKYDKLGDTFKAPKNKPGKVSPGAKTTLQKIMDFDDL